MSPKIKSRPVGEPLSAATVRPPLPHEVGQLTASANAASRRRILPTQPAAANHARHHVPVKAQS